MAQMILDFGSNIFLTTFALGLLLGLVIEVARILRANHAPYLR